MGIKRVIGIDFGTSSSIVKVKTYKDGEPLGAKEHVEYIRFDGAANCPTLIYKADDGTLFFGHKAENASVRGVLLQNFKMDLVSGDNDIKTASREYAQLFFNHLYEAYNESKSLFPPCDEEITYVSYPAKWPESERGFMVDIARKAGFANVVGIDEPSAAVHAVMVSANDRLVADDEDGINILLLDMGAGTTDLVLCKYNPYADTMNGERQIEILNAYPKADSAVLLGGREIDEALCEYVKAYLLECGLPNPKNFNEKYMDKCRVWKETNVSPVLNDNGIVRYAGFIDALLSMMDIDKEFDPLSRDGFENMLKEYISQLPKVVNDCLSDVGFKPGDVDYVVLTGGHSQWYFVEGVVKGSLLKHGGVDLPRIKEDPNRVIRLPWPQETVALGMVYQDIAIARRNRPSANVVKILQIISERYKSAHGRDIYVDMMVDPIAAKRLRTEAANAAKALESADNATVSFSFVNTLTNATERLSEVIHRIELDGGAPGPTPVKPDIIAGDKTPCQNCGKLLSTQATFCGRCGQSKADINGRSIPQPGPFKQPFAPQADKNTQTEGTKFCGGCGQKISIKAKVCPHCGRSKSSRSKKTTPAAQPAATQNQQFYPPAAPPNQSFHPNAAPPNQPFRPNAAPPNQPFHPNAAQQNQSFHPNAAPQNQPFHPNASPPNQPIRPTTALPTSSSSPTTAPGNLIKTVNASRSRGGVRAIQGKLSIYQNKIEYIPAKFPIPMPGDKQEFQMSEIALAQRCTIMAMDIGVELILKNGKTTSYGVGGGLLFKNMGADPQEIVDIINAQMRA